MTAKTATKVFLCACVSLSTFASAASTVSSASTVSVSGSVSGAAMSSPLLLNLAGWMQWQEGESVRRLLANISPPGTAKGAVIASPQRQGPDYFFVWTRDAAVTMNAVVDLQEDAVASGQTALASDYQKRLFDYVEFVLKQQVAPALQGLGEPKFEVDGRPFNQNWCRPQNDGPALRASVLVRFANHLLANGASAYVRSQLYDSTTKTAIKADLEYVAHNWQNVNCEPWEEVYGHHFYNEMVQRRALIDGARLARRMGDPYAADFYLKQADAIGSALSAYWDPSTGAFIPTLGWTAGLSGKNSGLDSSTVLAVLHSGFDPETQPIVSFGDPRFISTINALTTAFKSLYAINNSIDKGVAIGRYPEDVYGGINFVHGNPWVLITAAFANSSYRVALEKFNAGDTQSAKAWFDRGDSFMDRVQTHANADGSLSEQIDRETGYMLGAADLTWSHVEVIQAIRERARVASVFAGHPL